MKVGAKVPPGKEGHGLEGLMGLVPMSSVIFVPAASQDVLNVSACAFVLGVHLYKV